MSKDKGVLLFLWVFTIVLLFKYIPKDKMKHGILSFLFKQIITWVLGLLIVEKRLIKYPVRLFPYANKSSFSFEYFFFPAFCAIFNVNYPEIKSKGIKLLYYIFHSGLITSVEVLAEKYTNLIEYKKWKWYWSFITIGFTYYSSRLFYRWFFNDEFNHKLTKRQSI
ncbi:CBO0543 family protein [Bacillus spongiae]|uniref:CBO0543 family protein n=1 Tax=Bacillus spongiae TaxID=2683610 RepID=A0ABU8HEA5_9BACI